MSAEEKDAGGSAADPWDSVAAAAGAKSRELEAAEIARLLNPLMDDDEADDSGAAPEQLGEVSLGLTRETADADADRAAQRVYDELLERAGEAHPRPRIEPVRRFAQLAGMPQELYPIIQVAGTNGKTSTARIIETLLRAHGLRTGLFTSPHLVSFTERIQLDGVPIDGAELAFVWDSLQPALQLVDSELQQQGHGRITFFEALTVLAYAAFADAPVEVAVIEVGLGGQWDATNIADAAVSVFTPIDLDHTELLGDTLAQIARTKAGIIKSSSVVVSAAQDAAAMAEIEAVAAAQNASVHSAGRDFELISDSPAVGGRMISARSKVYGAEYKDLVLPLLGAHQAHNAVTALAAVEAFFKRKLDLEMLELGLRAVTSPGRMQLIAADPAVLVDAAHNPHGARALVRAVRESFNFSSGITLVVGVLNDKDAAGVLTELAQLAAQIILVPVESPRTLTLTQLAEHARRLRDAFAKAAQEIPVTVMDNCYDGFNAAREWAAVSSDRAVLIAGSVLLAGSAISEAAAEGW